VQFIFGSVEYARIGVQEFLFIQKLWRRELCSGIFCRL